MLGDAAAFSELLVPLLPRALQLARRQLRNPHDAEDLVQEAALRALERLHQFDRTRNFAPWFFRLLMNLGSNKREAIALRTHEELLPESASVASGVDQGAERAEFCEAFQAAVAALPPRQRSIVMLFDVDGYSGAEIAELLDVSAETVRWHLHSARKTLRLALQRFQPDVTLSW
jgi:RNA polymerase sigma-70 factor, ECF subfamily